MVINSQIHDFKLFKELKIRTLPRKKVITDAGYQEIQRLHANSVLSKKRKRNTKLTKKEKRENQAIGRKGVTNENVIGFLKRFKMISDRYRNRRTYSGFSNWEIMLG